MLAAREEVERLTISNLNALPLLLFHCNSCALIRTNEWGPPIHPAYAASKTKSLSLSVFPK